jgi:uncharacterized protein
LRNENNVTKNTLQKLCIMKTNGNPFVLAGYVSREYFCDREAELSWLQDQFSNDRNMVMYSWRRMGKTSLIHCFAHVLEKENQTDLIYVDLMSARNMPDTIKAIAQAVHNKYGRTTRGISKALVTLLSRLGMSISFDPHSGIPKASFGLTTPIPTEHSLEALGEFLKGRNKKIVLAIDEFQQITRFPETNAEAVFRSWMQSNPKLRFIFSGSQRNLMRSIFSEQNRPFYKSTQILDLRPIPLIVYHDFIKKHFKKASKKIDSTIIEEIYDWSRGQTYTIQLVCNKAFGANQAITPETLQQIYHEIIEQEKPVFYNYMKMLTNIQWDVLRAIGLSEPVSSPYSKDFITSHGLGAQSSVSSALHALIEKELVIQDMDKYFLHDVVLSRWFQQS